MVWYFIGVYIINRILHGRLEKRNFSSRVEKNISLVRCPHSRNIFQHSKRNFVSLHGHVISSISSGWRNGFSLSSFYTGLSDQSSGWCLPTFGLETDRTVIFRLYQQIQMLQPKLSENQKLACLRYVTNVCLNTGTLLLLNLVSVRCTCISVICTCELRLVVYL